LRGLEPDSVQRLKIVGDETVLIARKNEQRRAAGSGGAHGTSKGCSQPLCPPAVHAHLHGEIGDHSPMLVRVPPENDDDVANLRREGASALPPEQRLPVDRDELLWSA
jgi:hypothetical protein